MGSMRKFLRACALGGPVRALGVMSVIFCGGLAAALPAATFADANIAPSPVAAAPGLPDGRVNEQVTPHNKFGNQAGIFVSGAGESTQAGTIFAGADGNEVFYADTGPIGETPEGYDYFSVARHSGSSWASHAAFPRPFNVQGIFNSGPENLGVSADAKRTIFTSQGRYAPEQPVVHGTGPNIYMYDEDGTLAWLGKPTIADPQYATPPSGVAPALTLGGSPDYHTVFFSYPGSIATRDLERDPALGDISRDEVIRTTGHGVGGLYEWRDGSLNNAAVLPDGHIDPYGAASAEGSFQEEVRPGTPMNGIADEGKRLFFVSPDPASESGRPTELYVRTTDGAAEHTVLVSRDELLPASGGQAAAAPTGVVGPLELRNDHYSGHMFASPDGSRVFFQSNDRLVPKAPNDENVKEYVFDLNTETLAYVPVTVLQEASSLDGSRALLLQMEGTAAKALDLWSDGHITEITPLEGVVKAATSTKDGGVFAFETNAALPGFNNGGGGISEAYRYDVASNTLSCVSCPPAGVQPTGGASLSHAHAVSAVWLFDFATADRNLSADGSEVFFDTSDGLVPQDTNGLTDVYEWKNGVVYLLSSGTSTHPSFFGDISESANDVYFSSLEGLTPEDQDEAYDVYDARVPRPGDTPPATAVPCQGEVCQGPPSVPSLLGSPASATFSGLGNISPTKPKATVKKKAKPKLKKKPKKKVRAKKKTGKTSSAGKAKKSARRAGKSDRRAG
jgi:hypothetical protein